MAIREDRIDTPWMKLGRAFQRLFTKAPPVISDSLPSYVHFDNGRALLDLGQEDAALKEFRLAFEANPAHIEAGLRIGEIYLRRNDIDAAQKVYREVLEQAPDLVEACYGLAVALIGLGARSEAARSVRRAVELRPDFAEAIVMDAFLSLFPVPSAPRAVGPRLLICVPISPFVRGWLGGQRYILNFARTMSQLQRQRRPRLIVVMMIDDWQQIAMLRDIVAQLQECEAVLGIVDRNGASISESPLLLRYRRALTTEKPWHHALFAKVDLSFPVLYPCWGAAPWGRPIFWVPDLQHRHLPLNFSRAEVSARDRDMTALSTRSVPVIFSSQDASGHFRQFLPAARCRPHVWHFRALSDRNPGVDQDFSTLNLPERYYYTPNQFWAHKNHEVLFRALRIVRDRGYDITFVCTGADLTPDSDPHRASLARLCDDLQLGRSLRVLNVLPRSLQIEIIRRCCAVIQPSLFEGWSTVIEDARMFGRPLIVSDIPVHREQLGANGYFFNPADPISLADAVIDLDRTVVPGPEPEVERHALEETKRRVLESAEDFLRIAQRERLVLAQAEVSHDAPLAPGRGPGANKPRRYAGLIYAFLNNIICGCL